MTGHRCKCGADARPQGTAGSEHLGAIMKCDYGHTFYEYPDRVAEFRAEIIRDVEAANARSRERGQ
jgi:hypothetical protein